MKLFFSCCKLRLELFLRVQQTLDTAANRSVDGLVCARTKVRLYRNGDTHFAGMIYPVSAEHHRTLDALLEALTHSVVCDRTVLPQGVRYLFAADNGRRVTAVDQLQDGASYVCSTRPLYRRLNYTRIGTVQPSRSHHQASLYYVFATRQCRRQLLRSFIRPVCK